MVKMIATGSIGHRALHDSKSLQETTDNLSNDKSASEHECIADEAANCAGYGTVAHEMGFPIWDVLIKNIVFSALQEKLSFRA